MPEILSVSLEAPLRWWPSQEALRSHHTTPLERALALMLTRPQPPSLQCTVTRLGRSLLMAAVLSTVDSEPGARGRGLSCGSAGNPSGESSMSLVVTSAQLGEVPLRVLAASPAAVLNSSTAAAGASDGQRWCITEATRVAVFPSRRPIQKMGLLSASALLRTMSAHSTAPYFPTWLAAWAADRPAAALGDDDASSSLRMAPQHDPLSQCVEAAIAALYHRRAPLAESPVSFSSVLVTGPSGSGKTAFLNSLAACIPRELCWEEDALDAIVEVEVRHAQGSRLVEHFDGDGAVSVALQRLFSTSFTPFVWNNSDAPKEGTTHPERAVAVHRALLLILDDVSLLAPAAQHENLFICGATHQLCAEIDSITQQQQPPSGTTPAAGAFDSVVIFSACESPNDIHFAAASNTRLARAMLQLPTLSPSARVEALQWAVARQNASVSSSLARERRLLHVVRDSPTMNMSHILELAKTIARGGSSDATGLAFSSPDEAGVAWMHALTASCERQRCGGLGVRSPTGARWGFRRLVGIDSELAALRRFLLQPLLMRRELAALRVPLPKGALLVGPSGCGKTALLRALGEELASGNWLANFGTLRVHTVDAHTLVTKQVGESEKRIARMFAEARSLSPCALLLDNLDAIAPPRNQVTHETNSAADRTLSTFLAEVDGVRATSATVILIAAAPSAAALDPAAIRPGRLDVHVELSLPSPSAAATYFASILAPFAEDVAGDSTSPFVARLADLWGKLAPRNATASFADVQDVAREVVLKVHEREAEGIAPGSVLREESSLRSLLQEALSASSLVP